jgi:hypothetical protein
MRRMTAKSRAAKVSQAEETGPTPERQQHHAFSKGPPARQVSVVRTLLESSDISQSAADAGDRWYWDYRMAFLTGYTLSHFDLTPPYDVAESEYGVQNDRHDAVSFAAMRVKSSEMVSEIRDQLGEGIHEQIRMMLVDELNLSQIGQVLYPRRSRADAAKMARARCITTLELLEHFYRKKKGAAQNGNNLICDTNYA